MERGLYIAASGMLAEMVRQDQIANDLANGTTPGYKADRSTQRSFGDLLLSNASTGATVGPLGLGVRIDKVTTDMTAGPLRQTGEALDFAVEGDGFFAVRTPQGVRYTRNGQFGVSPQGTLTTATGGIVLGQGGAPIRVAADGTVDPRALGVFNVNNPQKQGDSLFTGAAAGRATGAVRSGAVEASNADPTRSMVDMIASFRAFESGQRVIRTIDQTLQKAANQVGSLPG
ncbi:MAG: flagellar basal-body rod protein FlgF [Thermoleophilaceae bacterium]|jgi:flagellar basal-body rod protein FlgF|nr:flagellar basal-body rod protein FlgF [Thermoleophilaceae bacterium]